MENSIDPKRGDGKSALILLHGLGMSWRAWLPVIPLLRTEHNVQALTLAGHRGGPHPLPGRTGVAMLADAVERELDARGIERAHLAGNSLGAWVACELAQRGRACAVVAFSPPGAWRSFRDFYNLALRLMAGQQMLHLPPVRMAMHSPPMRRILLRPLLDHADKMSSQEASEMVSDLLSCVIFYDLIKSVYVGGRLRHLSIDHSCPVRIAWPIHDHTIPFHRYGKPFLEMLPHAELVPLPGVGHVPMYDNPALVAETILGVTTRAS